MSICKLKIKGEFMRINFGIPQNNKLFNFSSINKRSNSENNHQNSKVTDRVSFSKSGRFSSMLEGFNKQKDMIIERKNEVVNKHLENGGELDDIDALLIFTMNKSKVLIRISVIYLQNNMKLFLIMIKKKKNLMNLKQKKKSRLKRLITLQMLINI